MTIKKFNKILVANRGEIALRIIHAIHDLGRHAMVIHSQVDRDLPFVSQADQAFPLGNGSLAETYLDQEKIIRVAKEAGADAIHPGYGFLSENAEFAERCLDAHITFIGPDPKVIRIMGDKAQARRKARELGIPVIKGLSGSPDELIKMSAQLSFPLIIKPSIGGGGKGMRIVQEPGQLEEAAGKTAREAESYFGSGEFYVEQFLAHPRHIEVQVIADHHGNAVHLFERECSLQRRYQKMIEEAPSPSISPENRTLITRYSLELVNKIGYTNAGTVEFLTDDSGAFYFMEMNTRIQVEHPVTEMLTGIDLVREQITVAEGSPLSFRQQDIHISGHVIEARLCAEDPEKGFTPSPGKISYFHLPEDQKLRIDSGYLEGNEVDALYDTLLAKIIVRGDSRQSAIKKLAESLRNVHITGVSTNRDYLVSLLLSDHFRGNRVHTALIDTKGDELLYEFRDQRPENFVELMPFVAAFIVLQGDDQIKAKGSSPWFTMGRWRLVPEITLHDAGRVYSFSYKKINDTKTITLSLEGKEAKLTLENRDGFNYRILVGSYPVELWAAADGADILMDIDGRLSKFRRSDILDERYQEVSKLDGNETSRLVTSPLSGRVIRVNFLEGESVEKGEDLLVIESMKMENKILSPRKSIVSKTHVQAGQQVHKNQLLITLDNYE